MLLDRISLGVVVVYVTQMEGRPTVDEVHQTITEKMKANVSVKKVQNALESTRKKGIVSIVYDKDDAGNQEVRYAMKNVKWANPPEIAHIKTFLPVLLATPEAIEIKNMLEDIHEEGETKGRQLDIRDYSKYHVEYVAVVPILGGCIAGKDEAIKHRRINGSIWLPMNEWMKAALQIKLRKLNVSPGKMKYVEATDVFLPIKEQRLVEVLIGGPNGVAKHEALDIGTKFSFDIEFPTTGFMAEGDFVKCLGDNVRIGAKHKDYGLVKLANCQKRQQEYK